MDNYLQPARKPKYPITRLSPEDRLWLHKEPYVATRIRHGFELVHVKQPNRTMEITFKALHERLEADEARIERGGALAKVEYLTMVHEGKQLKDFPKRVQDVALLRVALFETYEKECLIEGHIPRTTDTFRDDWIVPAWVKIIGRVRSDQRTLVPPSASTFNRLYPEWKAYDRNILAIVPRYRGPGSRTIDQFAESLSFMVSEARNYISEDKPEKYLVYGWYKAAVSLENEHRAAENRVELHLFKRTKFYEVIDSFPAYDVMSVRDGEDAARKFFAPNLRIFGTVLPGERIEIDEWKTDMMTVWATAGMLESCTKEQKKILKKIRLWICVAVDVATRYILAIKVTKNPNAQACLDALRMIMSDKTHISMTAGAKTDWTGRVSPMNLYWDHGSAFIDEEVVLTAQSLGIHGTRPETGKPKGRPHIESLFHTIGPLFTHFFSGRTFRNIVEKGDYDPKLHASLACSEFAEIMIAGACDYYHNQAHGSLGGASPHNAWLDATEHYDWRRPPHRVDLIRAFGTRETATIGRYGIVKLGIPYDNTELTEEHMDVGQQDVKIIYDYGYLNSLLVQGTDGGWFEVENKIDLPEDMTEVEWTQSRKEYVAEHRVETEQSYLIQREYILKNRANGIAATLRAGLEPVGPSPAKLEKMRNKLFRNYVAAAPSGTPMHDTPVLPPPDPLRGGTVGRPTQPQPTTERIDAPASDFERTNWDEYE
ncbi:transposase family protein [Rhizobium sp. 16-449-1b]|uniref:integrase catalytic domain-containing protein n=1 Tax=Rhizobium sp. 16-449-1b TaxID=2819989 RepID=UPI001ADA1140|nr:DDE-type integrase/transposase/recombinase [Rhizobium sp. 16-449-1b]MBO9198131.1 transposase family protein [Rhizobium sp. 16-449-1b]